MYLVGLEQVEVGMARALRAAFAHHHQFRWDPDESKTRIFIYDEWPLVAQQYPRVIVSADGGDFLAGHRGIGDEYADTDVTPISVNGLTYNQARTEYKSGTSQIQVSLLVEARSKSEARQVADWCVLFVRSFASPKFVREGLNVSNIRAGRPTGRLVGSDPVFSVPVTVDCLTSFVRTIPISVQQTIDGVCLVGVFTVLPDGVTFGETFM